MCVCVSLSFSISYVYPGTWNALGGAGSLVCYAHHAPEVIEQLGPESPCNVVVSYS